jgi:hypothetical protein
MWSRSLPWGRASEGKSIKESIMDDGEEKEREKATENRWGWICEKRRPVDRWWHIFWIPITRKLAG